MKRQTFFELAELGEFRGYRGGIPPDWAEYKTQAHKVRGQPCPYCGRYGREPTFMVRRGGGRNPETKVLTLANCTFSQCGHCEVIG